MMNKNKSESMSSRLSHNRNTPSVSSKQKGRKSQARTDDKPVIDIEIAKGLDTLDRQQMKNLKRSLKASKEWNQLQKREYNQENYVEEEIVCEDNLEQNDSNKKKLKNTIMADEIKQQIVECNDEQSPTKHKSGIQIQEKKVVYEQGKTKTYIKPRPISAIQKQQIPESRNSQIIKNSYDNNNSLSFRQKEQKNPFKKQQPSIYAVKREESLKLSNLLKRIKHLDNTQIEQLEIIMEKIQRGEIESVEGSSDIIKMNNPNNQYKSQIDKEMQKPTVSEVEPKNMKISMQHRSSIPTVITLENSKIQNQSQTQSRVIQHNFKKSTFNNNLITQKSSDSKSNKQTKSEIKTSKDSLVLPPSSFKQSINKQVKIQTRKQNILAIKIISNWGHPKTIGLTKIQVFSKSGERMDIQQSQIKGCSKRMLKLFSNNTPFTTNESEMWISPCPQPPAVIIIQIAVASPVGALRIWNYNKSQIQNSKGVKDIKVIANDEKWNGQVKKGCGNQYEDYSMLVKFSMNANSFIPNVEFPVSQKPMESMSIPLISKNSNNKWLQQTLMKNQLMQLSDQRDKGTKQKQENKRSQKEKQKVPQTKIQRSGSYEVRKNGNKSSISHRVQTKQQKSVLNVDQSKEPRKYLESEAESVKKDVQESLKKIRMNLLFGQDIISKDIENMKSIKAENKKSRRDISYANPIQQQMLLEERDSLSKAKQNKKTKLEDMSEIVPRNYVSNPPLNKYQKIQKPPKPSPIVPKKQVQQVYDVNKYMYSNNLLMRQEEGPSSGNKLQIKQDRIKIVKPALIKNVSSILNQKQQDDLGQFIKQLNNILPSHQPIKIPELPKGTKLTFVLLANYGDPYYVGLSKIEVFDKYGNLVDIGFGQISGNCEPHPISNLVNQNIKVYDKNSLWLSEIRKSNRIVIDMQVPTSVSLIRIWNYNQSRIHNSRGVKIVSIELDSSKIFEGEISKFNGQYNYQDCEYLVFTEDNNIINKIIQSDWVGKIKDQISDNQLKDTIVNFERPSTAEHQDIKLKQNRDINIPSNSKKYKNSYQTPVFPKGKCLEIVILSTWGDRHYVGLNKIEIFNNSKTNILSKPSNFKISAIPSSVSVLPGMSRDLRTVDKLASGEPPGMWLCPMNSDLQRLDNNMNSITIKFSSNQTIGMINIWNYSKTSSRGVREIMVILDDIIIYQGYVSSSQEKNYCSIGFTKDGAYLEQMRYQGYNEDNFGQSVGLINEKKQVNNTPQQAYSEMERPFTSVLSK